MKKGLDVKLIKSLAELGEEKHIDFKGRYFPQEFMMEEKIDTLIKS